MFKSTPMIAFAILAYFAPGADADEKILYNRDIRPILTDACFKCHGPAAKKGGLRLDLREEAILPAKSKAIPIKAGQADQSEVVKRIFTKDEDEVMPPPNAHRPLTAKEKELIKRWIAEGAPYQKHWSFETPIKAELPKSPLQNPIDRFIQDRLAKEGLKPSKEADRHTLIRRVAFALTGLPPTVAETNAFLSDKAPDAYEKMVDRYLASKHYGEEMARHWLDLARYADTHGLHLDNERQMWLYRDWVVRAYNDNMPFDQFTLEQLAGDLLPNATKDQIVATGFSRCNVTTGEGGSIDSEWVYRNAVDRTTTMVETWLGLAGGCCVCHDHKYDPVTMKDFYSLYAFFYSAAGPALDGNALLTEPSIKLSTPEQEKKMAELNDRFTKAQKAIREKLDTIDYKDPSNEKNPKELDLRRSFSVWIKQGGGKDLKGVPADVQKLLKLAGKTNKDQDKRLREYYLEYVCLDTKPIFDTLTKQMNDAKSERDALTNSIPGSVVFKEMDRPREAFVMMRGQYDKPGLKVEPGTPAILPGLKKSDGKARATRVDLARWLTSVENPLTSRVTVNRTWQQIFGVGIVKTSEDFGAQGSPPSHPELLDYLAVWFRENGWNMKALTRLMVTSATFRQTSQVLPETSAKDPENRLYARGPRFRLDAEQIRDNALFVSGLINLKMGGRGVRPYQPVRIWEPVAFTGSNTGTYVQDKGDALYRRSLYTFLKRTAPPPFLANFDAPNRESFCARRERSNTPLQALQLMNDVQHFEAARAFAQRMMSEGGKTSAERIDFAYRIALARSPEATETKVVSTTLDQYLTRFRKDTEAAKKLIRVGESPIPTGINEPELAAYTMVANLILNLDETLTRN